MISTQIVNTDKKMHISPCCVVPPLTQLLVPCKRYPESRSHWWTDLGCNSCHNILELDLQSPGIKFTIIIQIKKKIEIAIEIQIYVEVQLYR